MKSTFPFLLTVAVILALTMEEKESFDKCATEKGQTCLNQLYVLQGSASIGVEPREMYSAFVKMIACLRGICAGNSDSYVQNIKEKHNLTSTSSGADLKCDIDSCGITYLMTIMDHPTRRCCAADVFKACVNETCKDSTDKGLINVDKIAMKLFGVTSCPKDTYDYSCIVDLKCDIDTCRSSYLKTTKDHPQRRCRAAYAFTDCVHEACKNSPLKGFINITQRAMDLFGITSCTKEEKVYFSHGVDLKCDIDSCRTIINHPDRICCAAGVFKACANEACKDSADKGLINFDKIAMELFGATSCPRFTYDYSCIVDLKCNIDTCRSSYLKTTKDHPQRRCRAANDFTVCVHEACKNSPLKGFINIVQRAMDLFGITSCTKEENVYFSHGVDLKCDIDSCRTIINHPDQLCCAADVFKACANDKCKDSANKGLINVDKIAMELFGATSCPKDTYDYSCIVDLKCNIDTCRSSYLKTTKDHPKARCRAVEEFTGCVRMACMYSPLEGFINITKRAMDLFGITSCTEEEDYYYSCIQQRVCDIDSCSFSYLERIKAYPAQRCGEDFTFRACIYEACKDVFAKRELSKNSIMPCDDKYDVNIDDPCTRDLSPEYWCNINLCMTNFERSVINYPIGRCSAYDECIACVNEACWNDQTRVLNEVEKRARDLFEITLCT